MGIVQAKLGAWLGTPVPGAAERDRRERAIREVEQDYRLTLPEDFRLYLLDASPVEQAWDKEMTIWWPIERLKTIVDECPEWTPENLPDVADPSQWLFFADFSMWSWAWALCCGDGEDRGRVALVGGSPDRIVAASFSEFVELHLSDPSSLC